MPKRDREEKERLKRELESTGYSRVEITGGAEKQTYYTPSGKRIKKVPAWREYVIKDENGKIIDKGKRDANFDYGLLPVPPSPDMVQLDCPHCGLWHRTEEDIKKCRDKHKGLVKKGSKLMTDWERKRAEKSDMMGGGEDISELKEQMKVLADTVTELAGIVGGLVKKDG